MLEGIGRNATPSGMRNWSAGCGPNGSAGLEGKLSVLQGSVFWSFGWPHTSGLFGGLGVGGINPVSEILSSTALAVLPASGQCLGTGRRPRGERRQPVVPYRFAAVRPPWGDLGGTRGVFSEPRSTGASSWVVHLLALVPLGCVILCMESMGHAWFNPWPSPLQLTVSGEHSDPRACTGGWSRRLRLAVWTFPWVGLGGSSFRLKTL